NYATQLKEKQRLRAQYNIREAQMRRAYLEAKRTEGQTGKNMVELLETRLDALVLRAGFARTIAQARQMVVHRHIMVDGVRVDRPSFHVKPGQLIHVHPKAEKTTPFQAAAAGENQAVLPEVPAYLNVEIEKLHAKLERKPKREEIPVICDEQLVVEYYSRLA
ncbi:MAG: 30S ribosomal protein S4, partial [Rothia mucilaginosa]